MITIITCTCDCLSRSNCWGGDASVMVSGRECRLQNLRREAEEPKYL